MEQSYQRPYINASSTLRQIHAKYTQETNIFYYFTEWSLYTTNNLLAKMDLHQTLWVLHKNLGTE